MCARSAWCQDMTYHLFFTYIIIYRLYKYSCDSFLNCKDFYYFLYRFPLFISHSRSTPVIIIYIRVRSFLYTKKVTVLFSFTLKLHRSNLNAILLILLISFSYTPTWIYFSQVNVIVHNFYSYYLRAFIYLLYEICLVIFSGLFGIKNFFLISL